MHIVRFQGGFANQLFQLCFYRKLQSIYGDYNVYGDVSHYKTCHDHGGFKLRDYGLIKFIDKVPSKFVDIREENFATTVVEEGQNYYYNGYWQDERFFPDNLDFLVDILQQSEISKDNEDILSLIMSTESVSVHVRRGDYVDNYFHGNIANLSYIENAIEYIRNKVDMPVFFVFSDDPEWCRTNLAFVGNKTYFVSGNDNNVVVDMLMMSRCRHNVIANSSFSWWAQKLNNNPEKIVISPEYWFNEGKNIMGLNRDSFVHVRNVPCVKNVHSEPLFSILIPAFNSERTIRRCLASALNQTYKDIEVIVVDDASTDNSYNILEEYGDIDARIHLIRKATNESRLSARIAAMRQAKGNYIIFLDSDDYFPLETCFTLSQELERGETDILEFSYMREPERIISRCDQAYDEYSIEYILEGKYPHSVWNKCYSRKLVRRLLECCEDFYCNVTEDVYFSVLFCLLCNSFRRIDDVLYHYVEIDGMSTTQNIDISSMRNAILSVKNKNAYLRNFFKRSYPDYVEMVDISEYRDINYLVRMSKQEKLSAMEQLELLHLIDENFGSTYATDYDAELKNAYKIEKEFRDTGIKGKTVLILKEMKELVGYTFDLVKRNIF